MFTHTECQLFHAEARSRGGVLHFPFSISYSIPVYTSDKIALEDLFFIMGVC